MMNEENKIQNHNISPPLINLSIKNQKIVESLTPKINIMNKTTSESLYKNQDKEKDKEKDKDISIKALYKRNKNYNYSIKKIYNSNSAKNIYNKNNLRNFRQKYKKIDINSKNKNKVNNIKYKNSSVENSQVSLKIFNDLDKIHDTLLEDFKKVLPPKKEQKENKEENNSNINKNNNKDKKNEDNKKYKNKNKVINYFNKNNDNNKYYTVPIKSRTSYNFFPINKSREKSLDHKPMNINIPTIHKRVKSTEDKKPQHITRYLERKKINDLPVTYPLFLSYNNKYNSISEKNRVDKILNKLICLKTHLLRDPLNRIEIIKEFFLKNGFDKSIYFDENSITNFYHYLNQPFSFSPEFTLVEVVNEGINYKYDKKKDENKDMNIANFLDYMPKNRKWTDFVEYSINKKKDKNNQIGNEIIYNLLMEEIFKRRYINYDSFRNKTLTALINDLEFELRQIKIDKMNRLDKYNNLIATRKLQTIKLEDKNKFVPNLCLISRGFKEKCKEVIDKKNKKIIKNMNKQEHLKQINNRLYYDNIRKNNMMEFDRNDIQRKLKLTELVVMERAKKRLLFQKAKNNIIDVLKRIKKKD